MTSDIFTTPPIRSVTFGKDPKNGFRVTVGQEFSFRDDNGRVQREVVSKIFRDTNSLIEYGLSRFVICVDYKGMDKEWQEYIDIPAKIEYNL